MSLLVITALLALNFAAQDRGFRAGIRSLWTLLGVQGGARLLSEHAEMEERIPDRGALIYRALMSRRATLD